MIKLLPSEDGVGIVFFGSGDVTVNICDMEGAGFLQGMLPDVTRRKGQAPMEKEAIEFLQFWGKKMFNPTNKP